MLTKKLRQNFAKEEEEERMEDSFRIASTNEDTSVNDAKNSRLPVEDCTTPKKEFQSAIDNRVETVADYEDPIEKNLLKMGFMFDVFETENKTSQRILLRYDETQLRSEDESLISSKIVSEVNDKETSSGSNVHLSKRRKRKKRTKFNGFESNYPPEIEENPDLQKYWYNRYRLFSKFDEGIRLDAESWYSVTPEKISKHLADRCCCDLIVDGFCGAGGNTIQFAFTCERVIAIDIDPKKIQLAKHNATIYKVADRIEFIVGDFFKIAPSLKADVVFLSPPWGGPNYLEQKSTSLRNIVEPHGGKYLFQTSKLISNHIAFYLPRNTNVHEVIHLDGPGSKVEIEQNMLGKKVIALTAYFGELVYDDDDPSDQLTVDPEI